MGGYIPSPYRAAGCRDDNFPVNAEGNGVDCVAVIGLAVVMSGERGSDLMAGSHIPESHTAVEVTGGQDLPIRAIGCNVVVTWHSGPNLAMGGYVPEHGVATTVAGGKGGAVSIEG